jgi:DNA-binding XRE family transcriptional regulator
MKTRNWNKESGQNLKRQMDAAKLTNKALAQVVEVTPRTIKNWKAGEGGPKDHQRRSIEDLLSRLPGLHSKSHPHRFLFNRLRQAVSAGIKYEVVGLPGMLKSKVLQELRSSLSDDGHAVLLVETSDANDIQEFWNS